MRFRWLCPVPTSLYAVAGASHRRPRRELQVWSALQAKAASRPWVRDWEFPRAGTPDSLEPGVGWSSAAGENLTRALEVVRADETPERLAALADGVIPEGCRPLRLHWSLYDTGVAVLEGEFVAEYQPQESEDSHTPEGRRFPWEGLVQSCAESLARRLMPELLGELEALLKAVPECQEFVTLQHTDSGVPIWVSRVFVVDRADPRHLAFAEDWVHGIDEYHDAEFTRFLAGECTYVAQWINHLHASDGGPEIPEMMATLRRGHYFWASMQRVDENLRRILAWSMSPSRTVSVRALRRELERCVNASDELLMTRDEVRSLASRASLRELDRLLTAWEFDDLLVGPALRKVEMCQRQLSTISGAQATRSAFVSELLLLCIGLTSIVATAIGVVQFGRGALADPGQTLLDFSAGDLTWRLASQPVDVVLLTSLFVSGLVVVVYLINRSRNR